MTTKLSILKDVVAELDRCRKKLALAIAEQEKDAQNLCYFKDYAAAKRAALDLKRELTKLTQS